MDQSVLEKSEKRINGHSRSNRFWQRSSPRRTVPLWIYLLTILFFICALLGLGLGLGIPLRNYKQDLNRDSAQLKNVSSSNFNYSSFYGIPDHLPVVSSDMLFNDTELGMKTGFKVSNQSTTREYVLNITQALAAPDGYEKPMIVINNQFPGPLIEANSGDTIRVQVNNMMANWSTAMHWHGVDQKNTSYMDGVASITQCGIPPGKSFTYEFTTEGQRGTFWYHSHLSVQYTDGMFGPLIIHDPTEMVPEVDEEKIIFLGDWYHTYASVLAASYMSPTSKWTNQYAIEPQADNLLINGRNTYNCSVVSNTYPANGTVVCNGGELFSTKVESNKSYRLRLINHSTFFSYWFSIDNHTIEIVEMDGIEIEPISYRGVFVNIGQRFSIVVHTNQTSGNYYMRASIPTSCFVPFSLPYKSIPMESIDYKVLGVLSYDDTSVSIPTIGVAGNTSNPFGADTSPFNNLVWEGCNDMPFDMPIPKRSMAAIQPDDANMHYIVYEFLQSQNENRVFINKTSWAPLEHNATIWKTSYLESLKPNSMNSLGDALNQEILVNKGANTGVQLVVNGNSNMVHPWHLHGHSFQIVGWGNGTYGEGNTTWNLESPMRRDTITVPQFSHVVLRWQNDNPGMWAFHCHVAWHMEVGMFVAFGERLSDLAHLLDDMDPTTKEQSLGFCGFSEDQAFGTQEETEYLPPGDMPNVTIEDTLYRRV